MRYIRLTVVAIVTLVLTIWLGNPALADPCIPPMNIC